MLLARLLASAMRLPGVTQELVVQIGDLVADAYRVTGILGYGGMAEVFEANEVAVDRRVAIKFGADARSALFLRREAQALAAVRHRGLPAVYRLGVHRGLRYIALERLVGPTVDEHLTRRGRFAIAETLRILEQLASVLEAVHRAGMAHRDLKPGNVMLCAADRVVLLDFGIAVPEVDTAYRETLCGTPRYIAPEAIRGATAPGQAHLLDTYAFGAMTFEMLTGRPPFEGRSMNEMLDRHLTAPVPDLARLRGEAPRELVALVRACLAKDPGERPVSMEVIGWELRGCRRRASSVPVGRQATRMPALAVPSPGTCGDVGTEEKP